MSGLRRSVATAVGRRLAVTVAGLTIAGLAVGLVVLSGLEGCVQRTRSAASDRTPDSWCDEGLEACRLAEWERAWGALNCAIDSGQLDADRYLEACCARATVLAARGNAAAAHDELNRLAADAADPALVWSARASVYEAEGFSERAMEAWRTAQELDPDVRLPGRWAWPAGQP